MKILLTGATGAIGRALVPQLLAAGHKVTGIVRSAEKGAALEAQGATFIVADVLDREAIHYAVLTAHPAAIIHQATALASSISYSHFDRLFATTNRLRTEGTENLLAAAAAAGVSKFVLQSFCGWPLAKQGGPAATEAHPFDSGLPRQQRSSSHALQYAEAIVREARLEGVVLRYGGFYGPGTGISSDGTMVADIRKRRLPLIGKGTGIWSFIHTDDAAAATLAALRPGVAGIYNIVDDEPAPVREWLPHLAQLAGAPPPRRLPIFIGRAAGAHLVSLMTEVRGGSNAKAKRELGWEPRYPSWREGFAAVLAAE